MKKIGVLFTLLIVLSASQCKKEGENCNRSFFVKNESQETIRVALRFIEGISGLCRLEGSSYTSGESFEYDLRVCWEEELTNGRTQEIYIVDPSNYNDPSEFYPCDSIEVRNTILKKYELSLEDLQAADFRITYP